MATAAAPADPPPPKEEPQLASEAAAVAESAPPVGDAAEGETVELDAAAGEAKGEGEEEEGECGFCLFMKGGGCKEEFEGWEKCVQEAEEAGGDVAESCFQVTAALHKCMEAHFDYYKPILMAERAMLADLEAEKASATEEGAAAGGKQADEEEKAVVVPETEDAAGDKQAAAAVPEKEGAAA